MSHTSAVDIEQNKQIAQTFLEHGFKGEMDAAIALMSPDASWWVLGDPAKLNVAGLNEMPRIHRLLNSIRLCFPYEMDFTFEGVTAEGDRVAVEASAKAKAADGRAYANRYHFLIRISDQQVTHVREYMDTLHAYEFQVAAAPRTASEA